MLQVAIHGDDVLAARMVKSSSQPRRLAEITAKLDDRNATVDRRDFAQHGKGVVVRAVIHQHDLEGLSVCLHDSLQAIIEIGDILLLIMQRNYDGILWHGSSHYTGNT